MRKIVIREIMPFILACRLTLLEQLTVRHIAAAVINDPQYCGRRIDIRFNATLEIDSDIFQHPKVSIVRIWAKPLSALSIFI